MSRCKTWLELNLCVTLINLLIKIEPKDFSIISEQLVLESTALKIRWQSRRPDWHDGTGDCVHAAMKSKVFSGLDYSRRGYYANHHLGDMLGLDKHEINTILMGHDAVKAYGMPDFDVTAQDVAHKLLVAIYTHNRFDSYDIELNNRWEQIPFANSKHDWIALNKRLNSKCRVRLNFTIGGRNGS